MASVFSNDMVAHVWAQQTQDNGRSNNGQFYFSGRTLYSYGSHFAVGYIHSDGTVFLNSDGYSPTTNRHKSYAWRALGYGRENVFSVPKLQDITRTLQAFDTVPGAHRLDGYIEANANRLDVSAIAALYRIAGEKNADKKAARFKAQAARKAEKAAHAEAVAVRQSQLTQASRFAALSTKDRARYIKQPLEAAGMSGSPEYQFERQLKTLREAHKAASAAKRSAQKVLLWTMVKEQKAALAHYMANRNVIDGNRYVKGLIKTFRHYAAKHAEAALAATGQPLTSHDYREFAQAARSLDGAAHREPLLKRAQPALQDTMSRAADMAMNLAADEQREHTERRERERLEREAKQAETRAAWFAGERGNRWHGLAEDGTAYIRAIDVTRDQAGEIDGGELETSQGASVPLVHAVKAFRFIKLCRESGRDWQRNGHTLRVGHFTVDSVSHTGDFKAGCHRFAWVEIERLATELGVFEIAAIDTTTSTHEAA